MTSADAPPDLTASNNMEQDQSGATIPSSSTLQEAVVETKEVNNQMENDKQKEDQCDLLGNINETSAIDDHKTSLKQQEVDDNIAGELASMLHVMNMDNVTQNTRPRSGDVAIDQQSEISRDDDSTLYNYTPGDGRTNSYRGFVYRNRMTGSSQDNERIALPRLLQRDLPFAQSSNYVNVHHNHGWKIFKLIRHDWFHVILRYPIWICLLALLSIWTCVVIFFAAMYVEVDNREPTVDCGLGKVGAPIGFGQAFAFSLITTTTVGYGLPNGSNAFFENCPELQIVIYFQMVASMMFNAFLFAFFYSQVASADKRGAQILFSSKAIISIVDGQVRFQVRVYDVDASNPVVQAHIRIYVVTKSRPVPRPLRLLQPNDELGGMVFLSLPLVVSHHIDIYSLLHPPRMAPVNPSGLQLRQIDSHVSNREEYTCPTCGLGYISAEQLRDHIEYMVEIETEDKFPVIGTHLSIPKSEYSDSSSSIGKFNPTVDIDELQEYFLHDISEIICVVEAIEPISSKAFAGMHSYTFEDVVFNASATFSPCCRVVEPHPKILSGYISVDLDRFHEINNE